MQEIVEQVGEVAHGATVVSWAATSSMANGMPPQCRSSPPSTARSARSTDPAPAPARAASRSRAGPLQGPSSSGSGTDHGATRSTTSSCSPSGIRLVATRVSCGQPGDQLAYEGRRAVEGRLATVEDQDERTVRRQLGHHRRDRVVAG